MARRTVWSAEEDIKNVMQSNLQLDDIKLALLCMKLVYQLNDDLCVSHGPIFERVLRKVIKLKEKNMDEISKNAGDPFFSKKELFSLYKAPFMYDGVTYIWDANKNMVMDFNGYKDKPAVEGGTARVRGWGRIKYMKNPGPLFDGLEQLLLEIIKDCKDDPNKCVDALNKAWSEVK